jgi:hypothetical protein
MVQLSNDIDDPQLLVFDSRNGQMVIHRISIKERTIQSYAISIADGNIDFSCEFASDCSMSSDGNWFLGVLHSQGQSFSFLVDLVDLQGERLDTQPYSCESDDGQGGWGVYWSPDSSWFYVNCYSQSSSTGQDIYCFGSTEESRMTCRAPYAVYAISPDGDNTVVDPQDSQGSQRLMAITESDCLLSGEECEYWYRHPVQWILSASWDRTSRYLVWFDYPLLPGMNSGYTTIGMVDSYTSEERILTESAPIGSGVIVLSPDGQHVVFEMEQSYTVSEMSLETLSIQPYTFLERGRPYYGWWVIP